MKQTLKVFRTNSKASLPKYATSGSSCFDLHACIPGGTQLQKFYNVENIFNHYVGTSEAIDLYAGETIIVPSGLIFDLDPEWSVRIYPRSGLGRKGIILANLTGIIDSDYVDEMMIMLRNESPITFQISHGDRLCQGELIHTPQIQLSEVFEKPTQKTERDGGFGSTGLRAIK